jgi:hypothetical protein
MNLPLHDSPMWNTAATSEQVISHYSAPLLGRCLELAPNAT